VTRIKCLYDITKPKLCLALHNIRSVYNVGAIFRTADAAGVSKIYFCGYTPAPIDRFGRARKDIAKAALGAEKTWIGNLSKKSRISFQN
jgi:23S rRNA (guanosine2251-2'-O)-methyltransferase